MFYRPPLMVPLVQKLNRTQNVGSLEHLGVCLMLRANLENDTREGSTGEKLADMYSSWNGDAWSALSAMRQ